LSRGVGFVSSAILGFGTLLFPEAPRHDYRHGKIDNALASIAKFHGVSPSHKLVKTKLDDMEEKLQMENVGSKHPWYEAFTGPRMAWRTSVGMIILALKQLTGANYLYVLPLP
jgi:SP family sugar:H+ symporter-like MFS transporter